MDRLLQQLSSGSSSSRLATWHSVANSAFPYKPVTWREFSLVVLTHKLWNYDMCFRSVLKYILELKAGTSPCWQWVLNANGSLLHRLTSSSVTSMMRCVHCSSKSYWFLQKRQRDFPMKVTNLLSGEARLKRSETTPGYVCPYLLTSVFYNCACFWCLCGSCRAVIALQRDSSLRFAKCCNIRATLNTTHPTRAFDARATGRDQVGPEEGALSSHVVSYN